MNTIICGSKKYNNLNFDRLVDSFTVIVRNNFLLPSMGYGLQKANLQVCNVHVYDHYLNKTSAEDLYEDYSGKKMTMEHAKKVSSFLQNSSSKFVHYNLNNHELMNNIIATKGIKHRFKKPCMKCGLSHVAFCISHNVKPFLIGYSLDSQDLSKHSYNNHSNLYEGHDHDGEIELLCQLHINGLVDATLCLLEDDTDIKLNKRLLPTDEGLKIIDDYLR